MGKNHRMLIQNPRGVWKTLRNYKSKYEGTLKTGKGIKFGFDIHVEISHFFPIKFSTWDLTLNF